MRLVGVAQKEKALLYKRVARGVTGRHEGVNSRVIQDPRKRICLMGMHHLKGIEQAWEIKLSYWAENREEIRTSTFCKTVAPHTIRLSSKLWSREQRVFLRLSGIDYQKRISNETPPARMFQRSLFNVVL